MSMTLIRPLHGPLFAVASIALCGLTAAPAHAQTMTNTFGGFSKNSDQPIDIESDVLVVHDAQKYATFKGNVKAVQGTTTLRSRELDVHYVGSGSDSLAKGPDTTGSTPAPTTGAAAGTGDAKPSGVGLGTNNGTQISKIEARGEVVITSDQDQTTTSDWALYDVPAQLVTVGGNVVLMQGKNVLKGDRLVIDLKTGESRFENRGNTAAGGRIRALFMPKEVKPGDDSSKSGTSSGDKSAEKSANTGAGSEKAAAPAAAAEPAPDTPMPLLPGAPQ
jgi:lipopolysaccharide export system protein LptA